jgi:hypothetical protein
MMRIQVVGAVLFAFAAAGLAAQTTPAETKTTKGSTRPLTLIGCVSSDDANADQVTFLDEKSGTVYRLSGADAREYIGRHVQIVEAPDSKKVKIRGGLSPSPNAAAQAGSIDPTQAAMAAQGSTTRGTGTAELPEFRVKTVKPVQGTCPQK